jgi:N-glycosylase/DNA lyase
MAPRLRSGRSWMSLPTPTPRSSKRQRLDPEISGSPVALNVTSSSSSFIPAAVVTPSPRKASTKSDTKKQSTAPLRLSSKQLALIQPENPFIDLKMSPQELRPSATLTGQCFHWMAVDTTPVENTDSIDTLHKKDTGAPSAWGTHNATEWVGIVRDTHSGESAVVSIHETPTTTLFRVLYAPPSLPVLTVLYRYFQCHHSLSDLYATWSTQCPRLATIAACIPGVRVVQQDPWECLVSFLCSSNNNIPRITLMLQRIRRTYGRPLVTIPSTHGETMTLYAFPSLQELSQATETDLRQECGLGYRAKYLIRTMELLQSLGGEAYLHSLRQLQDPVQVQEHLLQFMGIGRKVADCIALFSLDQSEAIPVDVHVWKIARRDYDTLRVLVSTTKSVTPALYAHVGRLFRERFHPHAGWAHSLLFVAELPSFRPVLPSQLVEQMDQVWNSYCCIDNVMLYMFGLVYCSICIVFEFGMSN